MCWHWPIFPARRQASIFGSAQLNFCVRNGYRWTLCDKNTNYGVGPVAENWFVLSNFVRVLQLLRIFPFLGAGPHLLVHLRGLEPRTHWLRVSCSTNWAKGACVDTTLCFSLLQFVHTWEYSVFSSTLIKWNSVLLVWSFFGLPLSVCTPCSGTYCTLKTE